MIDPTEELFSKIHSISPNLNDTFGYASADSEVIEICEPEIMAKWWHRHGWSGLVAIVTFKRDALPIDPVLKTRAFQEAWASLHGYETVATRDEPGELHRWVYWFDLEKESK